MTSDYENKLQKVAPWSVYLESKPKQRISATIDANLVERMNKVLENYQTSRSRFIEVSIEAFLDLLEKESNKDYNSR